MPSVGDFEANLFWKPQRQVFSCCLYFQTLPASVFIWTLYCGIVGAVFIAVKFFNFKLHHMFDTCEVIEEGTTDDKTSKKEGSASVIEIG